MRGIKQLVLVGLLGFSALTSAHTIQLGQVLPDVAVNDRGEVIYNGKEFSYQPWASSQLPGKIRVVQAMAGRSSAKELNDPLMQQLIQANLPSQKYQTTTIVNTDDAIIGTASFVRSKIEDSKKDRPHAQFVVDRQGEVAKAWQLQPKNNAIILLDQQGKVVFVKEGALTATEVSQVMAIIGSKL